jgi:chemotaxis protein methyltransferase CheR
LATDVSAAVLDAAREGLFEAPRLQEVPPSARARYFRPEGEKFRLVERIRSRVCFERHNIMTDEDYPKADLILCRNVLIYFTREEQGRILSRFAAALPEGGALVLGRAETLVGPERRLFRAEFPAERIYRRGVEPVFRTGARSTACPLE